MKCEKYKIMPGFTILEDLEGDIPAITLQLAGIEPIEIVGNSKEKYLEVCKKLTKQK